MSIVLYLELAEYFQELAILDRLFILQTEVIVYDTQTDFPMVVEAVGIEFIKSGCAYPKWCGAGPCQAKAPSA